MREAIKTMRVAYRIGFSCAVSPDAFSAYADAAKWVFDPSDAPGLFDDFCRGWTDGHKESYKFKVALRRELYKKLQVG